MVHATEMAKHFGSHKKSKEWLRTQRAKDMIQALAEGHECLSSDLV